MGHAAPPSPKKPQLENDSEIDMITHSKQKWEVGQIVKVGFVANLKVVEIVPTPGDYAPDAYLLRNDKTGAEYRFVPHKGLERLN